MDTSQKGEDQTDSRRLLGVLLGVILTALVGSAGSASAQICTAGSTPGITSVAALCAVVGNTCAAGVATLGGDACVTAGTVLDFKAAGFPTVVVNTGGTLETEDKSVPQSGGCTGDRSPKMTILAGDLTIKSGGTINGDTAIVGNTHTIAGQIYIDLDIVGATTGSLVVEPGGDLSSDRIDAGNGRGGNITVVADGLIDVQALPACPLGDFSCRGNISTNAIQPSTTFSFNQGCGQMEITLVAAGENTTETITVDGTVQARTRTTFAINGATGGVIRLLAGADLSAINDPFSPSPTSPPNPSDNNSRVIVGPTGTVNNDCAAPGGCQIYMSACFVLVQGIVQAGGIAGDSTPGAFARESSLPNIVSIQANETIDVNSGGQVIADTLEGFKQHLGQGITNGLGSGSGCVFVPQVDPADNDKIDAQGKGGGDICLVARSGITVDGTNAKFAGPDMIFGNADDDFAVRARNIQHGSQRGGTVLILSTEEGEAVLSGNAVTVNGTGSNSIGGQVYVQAAENVDVSGRITSNGPPAGTNSAGGIISIEAVTDAITRVTGSLQATPKLGIIQLRECVVNAADNPVSNPAATLLAADCGNPHLVNPVPVIAACGAACSCIERVRIQGANTRINGKGLEEVKQVVFTSSCDAISDISCVVNAPFITQTDTTIVFPTPGCASPSDHVIIGDPGLNTLLGDSDDASPSTSCSRDVFPF